MKLEIHSLFICEIPNRPICASAYSGAGMPRFSDHCLKFEAWRAACQSQIAFRSLTGVFVKGRVC